MRLNHRVVPALLVLLAALVMFFRLADKSLWNDEAFSFFVAHRGPAAAVRFIAQDTQPPVYYLLLSGWLRLGHGVLVLRALSALTLALAVLPLYGAARRLADSRTAAVAGLLFAVTPLAVNWAQKARPYAMQTLFLSIAFWGFVEITCAEAARGEWIGQGAARAIRTGRIGAARTDLAWLAVALGGGLGMLTQQPAGFFLLGMNVAVLFAALPRLRVSGRWLINWTVSQVVLIGVWLLWLPWFLHQVTSYATPAEIARRHPNFLIDAWGLAANLESVFGIGSLWRAALPFLVLQLAAAGIGAMMLIRERRAFPVLMPILVPIITCVLGFLLISPIFGYVIANFVFIWLPYSILLGYAIVHLRPRLAGVALFGVLLLGDAWGLRNYYLTPNPPIDQVATIIRGRMRPGDGMILARSTAMRYGLAYYLGPRLRHELAGLDVSGESDVNKLLQTPEAALRHERDWVVLPKGEPSSVDLELLRSRKNLVFQARVADMDVMLFGSE